MANSRGSATADIDHPWPLPSGWHWEPLGDLGTWYGGGTPSKENRDFWNGGSIPWVSPKDMKVPYLDDSEDHITDAAVSASSTRLIPANSVVCVMRSGILRHSFPVAVVRRQVTLNQDLRAISPRRDICARYLAHYLRCSAQEILHACAKDGTTVNSIDTTRLMGLRVPVPPVDTQRRLTKRIDELFAKIEEGESALNDARAGLDIYRKSLLHAAVLGKLSENWRRNKPTRDTGHLFLRRLDSERLCRKQLALFDDVPNHLPELPRNWSWTTLGRLVWKIEAGLNVKCHGTPPSGDELGIVKISAVTWDYYDEDECKTPLRQETLNRDSIVRTGDFLISRANTLELVGAPVVVGETKRNLLLSDKVLRLCMPDVVKTWVYFVLKSPHGRQEIESRSTGNQLGMRNIPQEGIRSIRVPVPPQEEMSWITARLEDSLNINGSVSRFSSEGIDAHRLRQSVLGAAFRGDLIA